MGRSARALLVAVPLAVSAPAVAQAPASLEPPAIAAEGRPITVGVNVDAVSVTAVVADKHGRTVKGLGPQDVELLEDGVRQDLSCFAEASRGETAPVPLSVVLVLDTSGSMNLGLGLLQQAVLSFVHGLERLDRALVVGFNDHIEGSVDFTGDVGRLERFVDGLEAWGSTRLYDAVQYSLLRIQDQPGRKAIIVFSDGVDTSSVLDDRVVIAHARAVEATIYAIAFRANGTSEPGFLRRLSAESGGACYTPRRVGDLARVFAEISAELKGQYLVGYAPKRAPDSTWRRITLKVHRHGLDVRVRNGYFASPSRETATRAEPAMLTRPEAGP